MINEEMDNLMSMLFSTLKKILLLGLILISIILYYKYTQNQQTIKSYEDLNGTLKHDLEMYKTKEGLNAAKIRSFEVSEVKHFLNLATKDSTILKLQKLVAKNKGVISKQGSVSIINTESHSEATVPTKITNDPLIPEKEKYPVYESNFNLKGWIWGSSIATRDSTSYKLNYKEELSLVIGREKHGFLGLGKSTPYADVTLYNPYSSVKDMRVYDTKLPPAKRFGIGPNVSYGVGSGFKTQVFVGIGISWDVIQF